LLRNSQGQRQAGESARSTQDCSTQDCELLDYFPADFVLGT
jgi:hypothetical protein